MELLDKLAERKERCHVDSIGDLPVRTVTTEQIPWKLQSAAVEGRNLSYLKRFHEVNPVAVRDIEMGLKERIYGLRMAVLQPNRNARIQNLQRASDAVSLQIICLF